MTKTIDALVEALADLIYAHDHGTGFDQRAAQQKAREALAATAVPEHQQVIEAWTWFDANGDYRLSRNEPADYELAKQVTPLVAAIRANTPKVMT